jgi:isoleucyl-tRNA synthetase
MIDGRPDWCISRQRTWGVPITLFVHKETSELHPRTAELIEQVAQRIEQKGIDAWFELESAELLGEEAKDYYKITDTLDVWFDSGVTHEAVLHRREQLRFPADLYLEGSDQHRGWFQSSLLTSVAMNNVAPYKSVLTHGFTVDKNGEKMSKSKGNVIPPQSVMKNLGADVLRLWIASTDYRTEMRVSDEILERTSDGYRRLRNTARFLLSNLADFDPAQHLVPIEDLLAIDRWVIDRAFQLQEGIKTAYDTFAFQQIYQEVHHFCVIDLGSFYLDIIKDRQYTAQTDSVARRSAQTAMYHVLEALTRWLAPIISYTADEIWQHIPGKRSESVFLETWYDGLEPLDEKSPLNRAFWQRLMELRAIVSKELEKTRAQGLIGSSLNAEVVLFYDYLVFHVLSDVSNELHFFDVLKPLEKELHFILMTSRATAVNDYEYDCPEDAVNTEMQGVRLKVYVSQHQKCVRCWHQRPDVGISEKHPELCGRCVENVTGKGEQRQYA